MAKDAKLTFSFAAVSASTANHILQTATTGVVTLGGAADTWQRGYSNTLNVGGFTSYTAASGPVPPATETGIVSATAPVQGSMTGIMGCDVYVTSTIASSLTLAGTPAGVVTIFVEGANDSSAGSGTAGSDWGPVSAGYVVPASLSAKRVNIQLTDTTKPHLRIAVMVNHGGTTASTGTVTITNAALSLGRDGINPVG
jgi:hypothetical protein